jgi:hypothetical protein
MTARQRATSSRMKRAVASEALPTGSAEIP